jgi:hypothetical protein
MTPQTTMSDAFFWATLIEFFERTVPASSSRNPPLHQQHQHGAGQHPDHRVRVQERGMGSTGCRLRLICSRQDEEGRKAEAKIAKRED